MKAVTSPKAAHQASHLAPASGKPAHAARGAAGRSIPHESAAAQVAGRATYIDDMPEISGTFFPRIGEIAL